MKENKTSFTSSEQMENIIDGVYTVYSRSKHREIITNTSLVGT